MITIRRSGDRSYLRNSVQDIRITFDLGNKNDPFRNSFHALKQLKEMIISSGSSSIVRADDNMDIIIYVYNGNIHLGNDSGKTKLLVAGEVYYSCLRNGANLFIYSGSPTDDAHIFIMNIVSRKDNNLPLVNHRLFTLAERTGVLRIISSPDGEKGSLRMHSDIRIYSSFIHCGTHLIHEINDGNCIWLHVIEGEITIKSTVLNTGDGAGYENESSVSFTAREPTEIILFDIK